MRWLTHCQRVQAYHHMTHDFWTEERTSREYGVTVEAVRGMLRNRKDKYSPGCCLDYTVVDKILEERKAGLPVSDIADYWSLTAAQVEGVSLGDDYVTGREPRETSHYSAAAKLRLIAAYDRLPQKELTRRNIANKYGITEAQLNWIVSGSTKESRVVSPETRALIMEDVHKIGARSVRRLAAANGVPYDVARNWIAEHLREQKAQQTLKPSRGM